MCCEPHAGQRAALISDSSALNQTLAETAAPLTHRARELHGVPVYHPAYELHDDRSTCVRGLTRDVTDSVMGESLTRDLLIAILTTMPPNLTIYYHAFASQLPARQLPSQPQNRFDFLYTDSQHRSKGRDCSALDEGEGHSPRIISKILKAKNVEY